MAIAEAAIGRGFGHLHEIRDQAGIIARLVDFAAYRQQSPVLNPTTLQEAYDACFNAALGGIDSEDWAQPPAS